MRFGWNVSHKGLRKGFTSGLFPLQKILICEELSLMVQVFLFLFLIIIIIIIIICLFFNAGLGMSKLVKILSWEISFELANETLSVIVGTFFEVIQIASEPIPAGIYLFKVNNRNTKTRCEIFKTIKTPERRFNFKYVSKLVLVFLILTLSRLMPAGYWHNPFSPSIPGEKPGDLEFSETVPRRCSIK